LYQPFTSAVRPAAAVTTGPVVSYLNGKATTLETFPALSVQLPGCEALPLSGPLYVTEVQPAMPEVASDPVQLIPTAWLYQPFLSGARVAAAETPVGAVSSNLSGKATVELVFPALSVQVPLLEAPPSSGPL
jgi:hypothetical protein